MRPYPLHNIRSPPEILRQKVGDDTPSFGGKSQVPIPPHETQKAERPTATAATASTNAAQAFFSLRGRAVPAVEGVHDALDLLDSGHELLHDSRVGLEDRSPLREAPHWNAHGVHHSERQGGRWLGDAVGVDESPNRFARNRFALCGDRNENMSRQRKPLPP